MRGYLLLSEGRSGTNWLNSIANASGTMGWCNERLSSHRMKDYQSKPALDELLTKSRTDNDRFAVKLFPKHLTEYQRVWGADFIQDVSSQHHVSFILLERRDKIGQAISMARARMTGRWGGHVENGKVERYDFDAVARDYSLVFESTAFWSAYLAARGLEYKHFFYEDLVSDPTPYFTHLSKELDVPEITDFRSKWAVQRDQISEEWRQAFLADARSKNILASLTRHSSRMERGDKTPRTIGNFVRFLSGSL